jgi:hypothetical protein
MPEVNGNDGPRDEAPKNEAAKPAAVRKPLTPEERRKAKLAAVVQETDEQRAQRRASELETHFKLHMDAVKAAHARFPAPMHRDWTKYTDPQRKAWNERRKHIDIANRKYHDAVRRTVKEHREEEAHVMRERAANAKEAV